MQRKHDIESQKQVIKKIIDRINAGDYHDASILIRFYLNDSSYYWYKDINSIIENQITNLFYDLTYNTTLCLDFFKGQYTNLLYLQENGRI